MLTPGSPQAEAKLSNRASLRFLFLLITGLRRHCRVMGDSMLPSLRHGDIVIYHPMKPRKSSINKGCIVIAKDPLNPKNLIIKRVHKITPLGIELRGDNEVNSIDSRQYGLVNWHDLCGVVEQIISRDN